jgi:hypothetical protein
LVEVEIVAQVVGQRQNLLDAQEMQILVEVLVHPLLQQVAAA